MPREPNGRFSPGESGNPGGRPKGRSVTARLRDLMLQTEVAGVALPAGRQVADLVADMLLKLALAGDLKAIKYLVERNDSREIEELRDRIRRLEGNSDNGTLSDDREPADPDGPAGADQPPAGPEHG